MFGGSGLGCLRILNQEIFNYEIRRTTNMAPELVVFSPSLSFHTSVNSQFQAQRSEKGFAKCRTLSQTVSCHRTPLPGSTAPTHLENRGTPSHCQEEILIPPSTRYPQLYPPLRLDIPLQTQRAWRHTMKRVRIFLVEIRGLCYTPARFQSHSVSIPHQV